MLGPYSTSSALSTTHYKLVDQLEHAASVADHDRVLDGCIAKIESRWGRSFASPSQSARDLILILYCHSQRPVALGESVSLHAVRLAGAIGLATVHQRQIGYRACIELFPSDPTTAHSLKLLLINTVRADLHANDPDAHVTVLRWKMALRAITSHLATNELVAAVEERVFDLVTDETIPSTSGVRTLALDALKSLVTISGGPETNLARRARRTLSDLFVSLSSSTSTRPPPAHFGTNGSSTTRSPRPPPPSSWSLTLLEHVVAADSSVLDRTNPPKSSRSLLSDRLGRFVPILDQFRASLSGTVAASSTDDETFYEDDGGRGRGRDRFNSRPPPPGQRAERREGKGTVGTYGLRGTTKLLAKVGFGLERFLRRLRDTLDEIRLEEEGGERGTPEDEAHTRESRVDVGQEVRAGLEVILVEVLKAREATTRSARLCAGLILSLVETLVALSAPSTLAFSSGTLTLLLACLNRSLLNARSGEDPDLDLHERLFVLDTLALLPVDSWTRSNEALLETQLKGKGKGRDGPSEVWGEQSWIRILEGLRDRDENIRRATIRLLSLVDNGRLVDIHYSRLVSGLEAPSPREQPESHRARTIPLLLELLPYLSSTSRATTTTPPTLRRRRRRKHHLVARPGQLVELLRARPLKVEATTVFPEFVLKVLDDFRHHGPDDDDSRQGRLEFVRELIDLKGSHGEGTLQREIREGDGVPPLSWRRNVMLGLVLAGTVHVVGASSRVGREGWSVEGLNAAQELGRWFNDDEIDRDVKDMLSEPFLLALARLIALSHPLAVVASHSSSSSSLSFSSSPASNPSRNGQLDIPEALSAIQRSIGALLVVADSQTTRGPRGGGPELGQLIETVRTAIGTTGEAAASAALARLARVGTDTREGSLAEFGQALSFEFDPVAKRARDRSHRHRYSSSSSSSSDGSSEPKSLCAKREKGGPKRHFEHGPRRGVRTAVEQVQKEEEEDEAGAEEEEEEEDRIEEITRSIAALKREQAELKRERRDRVGGARSNGGGAGGRGGGGGYVESLMGPDHATAIDDVRVVGPRSIAETGSTDDEVEDVRGGLGRKRDTTLSTMDGTEGNEPPAGLLIELTETQDPFRVHC